MKLTIKDQQEPVSIKCCKTPQPMMIPHGPHSKEVYCINCDKTLIRIDYGKQP